MGSKKDVHEKKDYDRRKRIVAVVLIAIILVAAITIVVIFQQRCGGVLHGNKYRTRMLEFFGLTDGIDLKFAHAVNSRSKLNKSLTDSNIMILEADILIDPLQNIPIMAHPPANSSDLTLVQFLASVFGYASPKGVKLDFKQIVVVEPSLQILEESKRNHSGRLPPIILNADILEGPEIPSSVPVDAQKFLALCQKYDSTSMLSPGWTTRKPTNMSSPEGYSWKMVKDMHSLVKNLQQPVTFPVRASLIAASKEQLLWLLNEKESYSLTVWHSNADQYDVKDFVFLRRYPKKVFYDLPEEKMKRLKQLDHN